MTPDLYHLFLQHPLVTTDSRQVPPHSLFFALKGEQFDGNRFAAQALELGARYAIIDDPTFKKDDRFILVDDVLTALQQLALKHRQSLPVPVIGITGTNGKTTTKELIYSVLQSTFPTIATQGNLNNHIGVPLTILRITPDTHVAVIEMGANHPGEIDFLCSLALPTHGLITNIGRAHLEGFHDFEGVRKTKTELYRSLKAHSGQIFLNLDDKILTESAHSIQAVTYGTENEPLVSGKLLPGSTTLSMEITFPDHAPFRLNSPLFGSYNASNILAAAAVGFHFQVPLPRIIEAISAYQPSNNRSQLVDSSRNHLVLDYYNANPSSMAAALLEFDRVFPPPKVVVLGDMLELGAETRKEHLKILDLIERLAIDQVCLVGPVFSDLSPKTGYTTFPDSLQAREHFRAHPFSSAHILLKGSRGIRLETVREVL